MTFAVRMEVILALQSDPVWLKRVENCKTTLELQKIFVDFAKERSLKVMDLDAPEVTA